MEGETVQDECGLTCNFRKAYRGSGWKGPSGRAGCPGDLEMVEEATEGKHTAACCRGAHIQ